MQTWLWKLMKIDSSIRNLKAIRYIVTPHPYANIRRQKTEHSTLFYLPNTVKDILVLTQVIIFVRSKTF